MTHADWRVGPTARFLGLGTFVSYPETLISLSCFLPRLVLSVFMVKRTRNYAAGNAYMDAFARYRAAHGERAVSLDLGYCLRTPTS